MRPFSLARERTAKRGAIVTALGLLARTAGGHELVALRLKQRVRLPASLTGAPTTRQLKGPIDESRTMARGHGFWIFPIEDLEEPPSTSDAWGLRHGAGGTLNEALSSPTEGEGLIKKFTATF